MPNRFIEDIQTRLDIKRPAMFAVIMHNDDYTTMDVVVDILIKVFAKDEQTAATVMMEIHEQGESIVGVYVYDIAVTKRLQAVDIAASKGFPLKVTISETME